MPHISDLSREEKLKLIEMLEEKKRRKKAFKKAYSPNKGQLEVHTSPKKIRAVFSGNGCWAPGTKIRMFDGSLKAVEDVKVGDKLMGPDSTPRTVIRLYQGEEEMFRISPKYSNSYVVNKSHILSLKMWQKDAAKHKTYDYAKAYTEISVKDYLDLSPHKKRITYQWRPEEGVEYPESSLPLDPYFLGAWLGDGTSANASITTMDQEIVDEVYKQAAKHGLDVRVSTQENNQSSTYSLTGRHKVKNTILEKLTRLEVRNNKHIPDMYLKASKRQRLELLAGLIDTDGHYSDNRIEIIQKRENLLDNIRELVNSLGVPCTKSIKYVNGVPYYKALFRADIPDLNCRIKRKIPDPKIKRQRARNEESFKITSEGMGKFYGFQVDKDNLLLLDDYTVQRNSGKTTLAANEVVWAALGYNPITKKQTAVPAKCVVVLDDPEKVSEQWIPEIQKWFDTTDWDFSKQGKPYVSKIDIPNGSSIRFMFHLQEQLKFEGIEVDFVVGDEPPPRHVWIGLHRGGRRKHREPKYLFVGTPIGGDATWMREEIFEPWEKGERDDIECFRYGTKVNEENLSDGYIESFSKNLTEKEKRIRLEGEFYDLDGLALAHLFDPQTHVIPSEQVPEIVSAVVAIDPHPAKAHVACLVGCDRDGYLYYLKEMERKLIARDFARELREFYQGFPVNDVICDSLGSAEMTGGEGFKSFIQVLKEEGVRVRPTNWKDKDDKAWIERIREALSIPDEPNNFGQKTPKLRFLAGCDKIIRDINTVNWKKKRKAENYEDKLNIEQKDYLATLKYALASNVTPKSKKGKAYKMVNKPYLPKPTKMKFNWRGKK